MWKGREGGGGGAEGHPRQKGDGKFRESVAHRHQLQVRDQYQKQRLWEAGSSNPKVLLLAIQAG